MKILSPVLHSPSVHPFLLPVHPKQNCTVSTLCSECDLNSIYSSLPLSPTVAPSLNISHLNSHLCTFIFYSLPSQIIKKRAFVLLFLFPFGSNLLCICPVIQKGKSFFQRAHSLTLSLSHTLTHTHTHTHTKMSLVLQMKILSPISTVATYVLRNGFT